MIEEGIAYWVSALKPNDTFDPPTYQCTLVVDKKTAAKYESDGHKIKEIDEQPALFFKKYYLSRQYVWLIQLRILLISQ